MVSVDNKRYSSELSSLKKEHLCGNIAEVL